MLIAPLLGLASGTDETLQAVAFGGDTFLAVGRNGCLRMSRDAREWRLLPSAGSHLREADVVTAYLPSNLLERLRPQFGKLKPGARIVTHQFMIPGMRSESGLEFVSTEDGDLHRVWRWSPPVGRHLP